MPEKSGRGNSEILQQKGDNRGQVGIRIGIRNDIRREAAARQDHTQDAERGPSDMHRTVSSRT